MKLAPRRIERCASCTYSALGWRAFSSTPSAWSEMGGKASPERRRSSRGKVSTTSNSTFHDGKSRSSGGRQRLRRPQIQVRDITPNSDVKPSQDTPPWTFRAGPDTRFYAQRTKAPDFIVWRHIMHEFQRTADMLVQSSNTEGSETESWGISNQEDLNEWLAKYEERLDGLQDAVDPDSKRLWRQLRQAYDETGMRGLGKELKYRFQSFVIGSGFSSADINNQRKLADLRFPTEWYPATRAIHRTIHLHVGPTNSGKTYQALKRLENANSGVYAGPLRLLAHEVYTRLNNKGKKCALVTGEERRYPDQYDPGGDFPMISCTVEMTPINTDLDVAVIDEIQYLGDEERGWAWTQAFLGVQAKEVHLCGELRTVPLIEDLCRAMGEKLVIHKYERLSPLKAMSHSLGGLENLTKGDAVIVFSRVGIHAMKKEIENETGRRCAVVYGALPPETRAQQAALFNDPDNEYDYLVASDAIGMGLNLSIKRVIFEATSKHDGISHRTITVPAIKQIAGRAGRYRSAADANKKPEEAEASSLLDVVVKEEPKTMGLVTTMESFDLPIVQRAMRQEPEPITSAGIYPPNHIVSRFASYFPKETPFSYVLLRLHEISTTHPRFHLCRFKDQLSIADCIQPYNLTIADRMIFIAAPISLRDRGMPEFCQALARCISEQTGGELLDLQELNLEILDEDGIGKEFLNNLELVHKQVTLYLWLSYRFAGVFRSQALAFHVKQSLEVKINAALEDIKLSSLTKIDLQARRRQAAAWSGINPEKTASNEGGGKQKLIDTPIALSSNWRTQEKNGSLLFVDGEVAQNEVEKAS